MHHMFNEITLLSGESTLSKRFHIHEKGTYDRI